MLRHFVKLGSLDRVDRSREERKIVERVVEPPVVQFRRGAEMDKIVTQVGKDSYVEIAAAVGAGKSTQVPKKLAGAYGKLVIHTVPFNLAARALYEYLVATDPKVFAYADEESGDLPQSGVVLMTNAALIARLYSAQPGFRRENTILYLDEVHESDCFTATIRGLAPVMGFFKVIRASATTDPDTDLTASLPGTVEYKYIEKGVCAAWTVEDRDCPWNADHIREHTLMFIDRREVAERLVEGYRDVGLRAHSLHNRSTWDQFAAAMADLKQHRAITVVIVDSTYRSSFSFPGVRCVIDSCEVGVPAVVSGAPTVRYRYANFSERRQAAGRAGRFPGKSTVYAFKEPGDGRIIDVAALELDAAGLLYRMFGYRLPKALRGSEYAEGDVPMDIPAAFASDDPMKLVPTSMREPWVLGRGPVVSVLRDDYEYQPGQGGPRLYRGPSCHTVADVSPVDSAPPPPLPKDGQWVTTATDLDRYTHHRSASGAPTVQTIDSDESPLAKLQNGTYYTPPKRVASRSSLESLRSQQSVESVPVRPEVRSVPVAEPVVVTESSAAQLVDVFQRLSTHYVQNVETPQLDEDVFTECLFHRLVPEAPDKSAYFIGGYDGLKTYLMSHGKHGLYGLPEPEKLYAMAKLVEAHNSAVALVRGITRMAEAVMARDTSQWKGIVSPDEFQVFLKSAGNDAVEARCVIRETRVMLNSMPYTGYVVIPPLTDLENRAGEACLARMRVLKPPDDNAADAYWGTLNRRSVRSGSRVLHAIAYK